MACSLGEALDKYNLYAEARGFSKSTIDHTRLCVTLFNDFLTGNKDVGDITATDFRRFLVDLRQRPQFRGYQSGNPRKLSGTSVNTYARAVKAFFSYLVEDKIITVNPLALEPAPKKPKTIPKVYSESELNAFLRKVVRDPRNKAIVFFFLDTGVRLTGLSQLTVNTVDTREGVARVMGKGQKERLVPFEAWSAAAIEDYIKNARPQAQNTDCLFLTPAGHPLSPRGIQSMLARLGNEAGVIERLAPHKLRHTFATYSLKYGGNLEYIKHILGHSDIKTTSNAYLNVDFTEIKKAHKQFSPLC
jgi:site-specific recombinase XerD